MFPRESSQSEPYRFGTKTAYHNHYNYKNTLTSSPRPPEDCKPVHFNMVLRHGSRFPSGGDRKKMDRLLTKLNEIYNTSSPFRYQNLTIPWTKPIEWNDVKPKELSPQGEIELYRIAKRFRSRFRQVFDKPYWNKYYKFVARDQSRSAQSAVAFAFGLFENDGPVSASKFQPVAITFAGREENDKLLSSYEACPRYEIDVKKIADAEVKKFSKGPEIKDVARRVEERLRISGKLSLTFKDVHMIRRLCAFGIMNRQDDSWCALLSRDDIKILGYPEDLEKYYEHSYGNKLSYQIICVLLSDMSEMLEDFAKGKTDLRGVFRFASSGTLVSMLTIMGFFEGSSTLRADNYQVYQQNTQRNFTIEFLPTSANIAMVLYECNSTEKAAKHEYKVQVLLNEKPIGLPCCRGNITCDLDEFLSYFKETVDSCDFDAMCSLPATAVYSTTPGPKALASIFRPQLQLMLLTPVITMFLQVKACQFG